MRRREELVRARRTSAADTMATTSTAPAPIQMPPGHEEVVASRRAQGLVMLTSLILYSLDATWAFLKEGIDTLVSSEPAA